LSLRMNDLLFILLFSAPSVSILFQRLCLISLRFSACSGDILTLLESEREARRLRWEQYSHVNLIPRRFCLLHFLFTFDMRDSIHGFVCSNVTI
jgi:hypothetical protein